MSGTLRACVIDADILISLHHGGILTSVFGLGCYPVIPDLLLVDLPSRISDQLRRFGLSVSPLVDGEIDELVRLRAQYKGPSDRDLAAFLLARRLGARLLTAMVRSGHLQKTRDSQCTGCSGCWIPSCVVTRSRLALRSRRWTGCGSEASVFLRKGVSAAVSAGSG